MVNTRSFEPGQECYVILIQYEHVFYFEVPSRASQSYVVRYDPRGRAVEYNVLEEEDHFEEENDVDQLFEHVLDHEDVKEVQGDV